MIPSMLSANFYFIIIIILILVVVILYFYFKLKFSQQKSQFTETLNHVQKSEKNKNELLSIMSDDIYHLSKNLVDPEDSKNGVLEEEILTSANNLRELLKIQANKIEIYNEKFVFSHMLDDISTYLASNFNPRNTEVIFDINDEVPRYLTGDVTHLGRIINNILEFSIQSTSQGKVLLSISCDKPIHNEIILNIKIKDNGKGLGEEAFSKLFDLVYDDKRQEHIGLRLYIAKKLTLAIGGTIVASSGLSRGNTFTLQIPMGLNEKSKIQELTAFKEGLADKKVLIYADKVGTGKSFKKLFDFFYKEVVIAKREEIEKRLINLIDFDLIVLEDIFFNTTNNQHLQLIKENKDLHIVSFNSIFSANEHKENVLVDCYIQTPSNQERIVELITQLEDEKKIDDSSTVKNDILRNRQDDGKSLVYKDPIPEVINFDIDYFTSFKGSRLLIVEDNLINQKIIVSVLKKSDMEIDIANNGQEALDLLFIEMKEYDIILMDISMPVMDGLSATKSIREHEKFDNTPIVTFTAFAIGAEIEEMFSVGCNAYLTKPLNIKKLYTIFEIFLRQRTRKLSAKKAYKG